MARDRGGEGVVGFGELAVEAGLGGIGVDVKGAGKDDEAK